MYYEMLNESHDKKLFATFRNEKLNPFMLSYDKLNDMQFFNAYNECNDALNEIVKKCKGDSYSVNLKIDNYRNTLINIRDWYDKEKSICEEENKLRIKLNEMEKQVNYDKEGYKYVISELKRCEDMKKMFSVAVENRRNEIIVVKSGCLIM